MLLILALLISCVFSQDKIISVNELYKYVTGILLFLACASLEPEKRKKIISIVIYSCLLASLFAIYQYFFGFRITLEYIARQESASPFALDYLGRQRAFFPFVTPNILGGYLAMIIPLILAYKKRLWPALPIFIALLLTKSIGAFLCLFLGLTIYFSLQGKPEKKKLLLLAGLLSVVILITVSRSMNSNQHTLPVFSALMRLDYWGETLEIIKGVPLTGIGLGNLNLAHSRYAHNSYLQIWAEMGILGIISFLWLVIAVFKTALGDKQKAGFIAAAAIFLAHNFVDFSFFLPEVAMIWWLIAGLALS